LWHPPAPREDRWVANYLRATCGTWRRGVTGWRACACIRRGNAAVAATAGAVLRGGIAAHRAAWAICLLHFAFSLVLHVVATSEYRCVLAAYAGALSPRARCGSMLRRRLSCTRCVSFKTSCARCNARRSRRQNLNAASACCAAHGVAPPYRDNAPPGWVALFALTASAVRCSRV